MSNQDTTSPEQSKVCFDQGEKLYEQGQFKEAAQAYSFALNLEPSLHVCYLRLGQISVHLGQYSEAITQYKKAIELKPDFVMAHHCLGYALSENHQYYEAIESYQKAINIKPPSASVTYLKLGNLLEKISQFEAAINTYKKAIELEPLASKNYVNLAAALLKINDVKGAISHYQKAIQLDPSYLESYYNLGLILTDQENYEQAGECFLEALKHYPGYHLAYKGIAYLLQKEGIHDPAVIRLCYSGQVPKFILKKFCQSENLSFFQSFDEGEAVKYISLESEYKINFFPPQTIHEAVHKSFPKAKNIQETFVIECKNALAYGDAINSAVITQNGNLLRQASTGNYELVFSAVLNRDPLDVEGKVVFLPTKFGGGNYYHWMFDTISRIDLLQRAGIDLETVDKFVMYTCQSKFQQEIIKSLGVPDKNIIESRYSPLIKAQEIVIPSPSFSYPSQWACDFLRKSILGTEAIKKHPKKRIYISRKMASHRKVVNEEGLIVLLKNNGFESVMLESMSVLEQAQLLSQCETVIAPHGGGLTNLLFCCPGTKVIEIFSKNYINPCYYILSNSCKLKYYYILADEVRNCDSNHQNRSDIWVDLERVHQILSLTNTS